MILETVNRYLKILPTINIKSFCLDTYVLSLTCWEMNGGQYEDLSMLLIFKDIQALHIPTVLDDGPYTVEIASSSMAEKLIPDEHFSFDDFVIEQRKCYFFRKNGEILGYYIDGFDLEMHIEPPDWADVPIPCE